VFTQVEQLLVQTAPILDGELVVSYLTLIPLSYGLPKEIFLQEIVTPIVSKNEVQY